MFAADTNAGPDLLDHAAMLQPLAELLGHPKSQMPLTAALLGGPGAGKSFAMSKLAEAVRARAAAARNGGNGLHPVFVAQINAAELSGDVAGALGAAMCQALLASGVPEYASLAQQAAETHTDPHLAAEAAQEKLAAARISQDAESRTLSEMKARAARLAESLLNDPAGTPLDAYVRANRSGIDNRMRGFGFVRGDGANNFRDLVRDLHESGGSMPGTSAFLRALWAFKGQVRLIFWAVLLAAAGIGIGVLESTKTVWLAQLTNWGPNFSPVAGWIALHADWLPWLRLAAFGLAGLCLLRNVWRAWRFTRPLVRGLGLLRGDIEAKRASLDTLMAQQTRRVENLAQEIQKHEKAAATAAERASANGAKAAGRSASIAEGILPQVTPAQSFLANLETVMTGAPGAPRRIIAMLDNLDGLPGARAADVMETAGRVFSTRTYATVFALDPKTIAAAWSDSAGRLDKLVQIPVQIGRNGLNAQQSAALVLNFLGHGPAGARGPSQFDPAQSMLDRPITVTEAKLLTDLALLAGRTARTVKRLVNLYRLARAPSPEAAPTAAFMLALDIGGTPAEVTALRNALANTEAQNAFAIPDGGPRLEAALNALRNACGGNPTGAMMLAGLAAASAYMRR